MNLVDLWCNAPNVKRLGFALLFPSIFQPPMGTIDLMECVSPLPIMIISRDICARPNTFALETIRPGRSGETETLVLKRSHDRKNAMVERHMLSADTKEVCASRCLAYPACMRKYTVIRFSSIQSIFVSTSLLGSSGVVQRSEQGAEQSPHVESECSPSDAQTRGL